MDAYAMYFAPGMTKVNTSIDNNIVKIFITFLLLIKNKIKINAKLQKIKNADLVNVNSKEIYIINKIAKKHRPLPFSLDFIYYNIYMGEIKLRNIP